MIPKARSSRFVRRSGTIPGTPVPWPGWRPGCVGNSPRPTRPLSSGCRPSPACPLPGRSAMLFGLAHVFDARAEFARAADSAAGANAMQLADFRRRGRAYDPTEHKLFVDRLLEAFTPEFFERVRGWGLETERPVFVVGMPRSGTTLVEQILASHRRVFGAGELQLARNTFRALPEVTGRGGLPHECLEHLDREALGYLAREHLQRLAARNASADRVVDKMPENTLYLGLMAALFPRAKFIHCRRDLRDVAFSCWMTNFDRLRWACDQHHIASRAAQYNRVMDHWRRVLPVPVFEVDYESIVAGLEDVSRELVGWCGLEWDPACLEFYETRRPVRTASAAQVRRPIYSNSIGRWKNYERALAGLFAEARERRVSAEWDSSGEGPRSRFGLLFDVDDPCSRFGFVLSFGVRGKMHYHGRATASIALWGTASGC